MSEFSLDKVICPNCKHAYKAKVAKHKTDKVGTWIDELDCFECDDIFTLEIHTKKDGTTSFETY